MTRLLFIIIACDVLLGIAISNAETDKLLSLEYGTLSPSKATDSKFQTPSSLTAKYGFSLSKDLKPYIGTGLAYNLPVQNKPGGASATVTGFKAGVAGQIGLNYMLGGNTSLNVDYKYLHLTPNPTQNPKESPQQAVGIGLDVKF